MDVQDVSAVQTGIGLRWHLPESRCWCPALSKHQSVRVGKCARIDKNAVAELKVNIWSGIKRKDAEKTSCLYQSVSQLDSDSESCTGVLYQISVRQFRSKIFSKRRETESVVELFSSCQAKFRVPCFRFFFDWFASFLLLFPFRFKLIFSVDYEEKIFMRKGLWRWGAPGRLVETSLVLLHFVLSGFIFFAVSLPCEITEKHTFFRLEAKCATFTFSPA